MSYLDYGGESLAMYFRAIRSPKCNPLSLEEELKLGKRISEGDKSAKNELIEHNLRFVVKVAKRFTGYGLSLQDLIEEGNMGLIKAVDKYDYKRELKVISYAVWWIKQSITMALRNNSRPIRITSGGCEQISKIEKFRNAGYSDERIPELTGIPQERILEITSVPEVVSLSSTNENGKTIEKSYPDERYSPENAPSLEHLDVTELVERELTPREAGILKLTFGLQGGAEYIQEEIGKIYNITRARVWQIKEKSLKKLRKKIKCASFDA